MFTSLNVVELASFNIVFDKLECGWACQLEHCFWQAWTWLSWLAWTCMVVDRLVHACWNRDCSWLDERTELNNIVGTIMINQQPIIVAAWQSMLSGNDELTRLNSDVTTTVNLSFKSSFACSNTTPVDSPRCIQYYVEIWLNNTVILPILFYHVNRVVVELTGNPVYN